MKPERIQFAPWVTQWVANLPFLRKVYACETEDEAMHCVNHVRRVSRFFQDSEVKSSSDENFVVHVRILPAQGEVLTDSQHALSQWIDEAVSFFLVGPDETELDGDLVS